MSQKKYVVNISVASVTRDNDAVFEKLQLQEDTIGKDGLHVNRALLAVAYVSMRGIATRGSLRSTIRRW